MSKSFLRRGRLPTEMDKQALEYTSSIAVDKEIFEADLKVTEAHVAMLINQKIIPSEAGAKILSALAKIRAQGYNELAKSSFEDIHEAIESKVIEMVGEHQGGWVHTGRSRNDEVATCLRIRLREYLIEISESLINLLQTLLEKARSEKDALAPAFTHTQIAQPTTFGHILLAHFNALARNLTRLLEVYNRVNQSPLGSGALTTTSYNIDRRLTADLLGFNNILDNSIDAVGSRDFILEAMATYTLLATDISRLCEELILFSSDGYRMVELADEYSSTSSIMPQKKNPDTAEVARARCAQIVGMLTAAFTLCKGLPFSYNRDLQELNKLLWHSSRTILDTLKIVEKIVATLKVNRSRMRQLVEQSYSTTTELADTIVRESGIPFRAAHTIVGLAVKKALEKGIEPNKLNLKMINTCSKKVLGRALNISEEAIRNALDPATFISRRRVEGGPALETLSKAFSDKQLWLKEKIALIKKVKTELEKADNKLRKTVAEYTTPTVS
ncbi:MAG: argininosuccinate lyase [Nitrososphaerales archaeon]